MEAEISKGVNQIYAGLLGREAENIKTYIIKDTVLITLKNVLTTTELQVAKTTEGLRIIKEMCMAVVENNHDQFKESILQATKEEVVDTHHDISIKTGREIFFFLLKTTPEYSKENNK
jgi:hypothetical protein